VNFIRSDYKVLIIDESGINGYDLFEDKIKGIIRDLRTIFAILGVEDEFEIGLGNYQEKIYLIRKR
jgi:hypothetical protein